MIQKIKMVVCHNFLFQVCKMRWRRSDSMHFLQRMLSFEVVYPTQYCLVRNFFKMKKKPYVSEVLLSGRNHTARPKHFIAQYKEFRYIMFALKHNVGPITLPCTIPKNLYMFAMKHNAWQITLPCTTPKTYIYLHLNTLQEQ